MTKRGQRKGPVMFALVALTALILVAGAAWIWMERPSTKRLEITLAYVPVTQILPLLVAEDEGLFTREGLSVRLLKFQAPNQVIDALVSGRAQVGSGPALITLLALQQFPGSLNVLGLTGGSATGAKPLYQDALLTLRDSPITNSADLRGKKLGITPGIHWRFLVRTLLKNQGLDPDHDVQIQEIPLAQHIPALLNGDVEATLSLEPVGAVAEATGRLVRRETNPAARHVVDPCLSGAYLMTKAFRDAHPREAAAYINVLREATAKVQADFPKYRPLFARALGLQPEQLEHMTDLFYAWPDDPETAASYQKLADLFRAEGVLKDPFDVRTVLYAPAPSTAHPTNTGIPVELTGTKYSSTHLK